MIANTPCLVDNLMSFCGGSVGGHLCSTVKGAPLRVAGAPFDQISEDHRETFYRRLAEAQAFGDASDALSSQRPKFSARGGLTIAQRLVGWMLVFGFAAGLVTAPRLTIDIAIVALGLVFAGLIGLRFLAAAFKLSAGESDTKPSPMRHDLPVITLLIPLHKEAAVPAGSRQGDQCARLSPRPARHKAADRGG
jgi:hypothetical protein